MMTDSTEADSPEFTFSTEASIAQPLIADLSQKTNDIPNKFTKESKFYSS